MSETEPFKSSQEKEETSLSNIKEIESLKKALRDEQEKNKDYLNRLKYLQADFENFQKRTRKEMDDLICYGNQNLILKLLTVMDELEYAIEAGKCSNDEKAITKGVEMTFKKMYEILKGEGLTRVEVIGKNFDPTKHDAVEKIPTKDYMEGIVIEEIRKGYMFKGRAIRPSLVKVAIPLVGNIEPNNNKKVIKNE